jgi:hypothetical protein
MSSGNVSRLWPGMNHVVLILYLSNSFRRRCVPTVPANRPRLMSLVLSSPPYEPSQPANVSGGMDNYGLSISTAYSVYVNSVRDENALLAHCRWIVEKGVLGQWDRVLRRDVYGCGMLMIAAASALIDTLVLSRCRSQPTAICKHSSLGCLTTSKGCG